MFITDAFKSLQLSTQTNIPNSIIHVIGTFGNDEFKWDRLEVIATTPPGNNTVYVPAVSRYLGKYKRARFYSDVKFNTLNEAIADAHLLRSDTSRQKTTPPV